MHGKEENLTENQIAPFTVVSEINMKQSINEENSSFFINNI
jgi:hypothetical protein